MIAKAPLHLQVICYGKVHSKGSQGQNGNLHIKQGPLIPQNLEFTTPELCFGPASLPISSYTYTERLCTTHSWLPQSSLIGHSKKTGAVMMKSSIMLDVLIKARDENFTLRSDPIDYDALQALQIIHLFIRGTFLHLSYHIHK